MSITISAEDSRSIKSITIASGASSWLKCTAKDGRALYGVPSGCQPGRFYLVSADSCDCTDRQRHQGQACKHMRAVQLHEELTRAAQRPVLEMVRHADGEISWDRRPTPVSAEITAQRARLYSKIQAEFERE